MVEAAKDPIPGLGDEVPRKPIANEELKYVFKAGRDFFPSKAYTDDGNTEFYTKQNLEARENLRNNVNVRSAIEKFMASQFPGAKIITKEDYMRVFMRVGTILRPGIDLQDLQKLIEEDFEQDSQPNKKKLYEPPQKEGDDSDGEEKAPSADKEKEEE